MSTCDVGLEADSYDMRRQACTAEEVNRPDGLDFFKASARKTYTFLDIWITWYKG